ncbi:MAG: hypothetical protein NTNFB02_06990 [Nitrospira sp.]
MLDRFLGMASSQGFRPRIPNAVAFAKRSAVLLLEHAVSGVGVDLTISRLPFDSEAVERARLVVMEDLEFPLVTPEDLIIMKAVAHRPQDIQDIQAVVRANSGLDVGRIRTHVQAFARALDMPELWKDIARLLKSRKATASRKASKTRKGK